MVLTKEQLATKQSIAKQLLAIKENSYANMMAIQKADMVEAEKTNENEQNMFEDGKVDQSLNRVEARASVLEALQRDIDILSNIDSIDATKEVQLGDVIETDQGNFFVAVPADEFEVAGVAYRGISVRSPLYQALAGKQNGDEVEVSGTKYTLSNSY